MHDELQWNEWNISLKRILTGWTFKFRSTQNNKKVLIEGMDLIYHCIYIDETYGHSGHTSYRMWSDESLKGLFKNIGNGPTLIIVHAGSKMRFIPNRLLFFKSDVKTGDYHSNVNAENYGRWLILPNLPTNFVVVIDNATYYSTQTTWFNK